MKSLLRPQVLDESKYVAYSKRNVFPTEQELLHNWHKARLSGVNLAALAYAASEILENYLVPTIKHLGSGSLNIVFLLTYPDESNIIARVARPWFRIPEKLSSVVATMTFAKYVSNIPCPKIYAWNDSDRTIVGAPYILMEKAHGVLPWQIEDWTYDEGKQLRVLDSIAQIHTKLARPLTFSPGIGSIYFNANPFSDGTKDLNETDYSSPSLYRLGPFARSATPSVDGLNINSTSRPHHTLKDFWDELISAELSASLQRLPHDRSIEIIHSHKTTSLLLSDRKSATCTLGDVLEAGENLRMLASSCTLPEDQDLMAPCLVSADFAFRNIFIDTKTLEVSAVLDWDDFSVMPLILCTRIPEDICFCLYASRAWRVQSGSFSFVPCQEPPPPDLPEEDGMEITFHEQRHFYKERLGMYDERFSRPGFWALREDALKIQYLATFGWLHWLSRDDWLKGRVGELVRK